MKSLLVMQQGARSVAGYALEFLMLVVEASWNESPLISVFHQGLSSQLRQALVLRERLSDLDPPRAQSPVCGGG